MAYISSLLYYIYGIVTSSGSVLKLLAIMLIYTIVLEIHFERHLLACNFSVTIAAVTKFFPYRMVQLFCTKFNNRFHTC